MVQGARDNLFIVFHIFNNQEIDSLILLEVQAFPKNLTFIICNKIEGGVFQSSICNFMQFFGGVCTDIRTHFLL